MVSHEIIIFVTILISVLFLTVKNLNSWTMRFNKYLIKKSIKTIGSGMGWQSSWGIIICKASIIFAAFMVIVFTYSLVFSL